MSRWRQWFFFIAMLPSTVFWAMGCAPTFPRETLNKVNKGISFQALQRDPESFKGEWVMLAGVVVASKHTTDGGTVIEVLQRPMDSDGRPLETDTTEGRFLVQSERFLDTAVYHKGRLITVIAEVIGRRELPLDEIMYRYPLLAAKDQHLWSPTTGPRFFFGIGIWHRF